jgi:hypothetical protein
MSPAQTMIDFDAGPAAPPRVPERWPSVQVRFLRFVTANPGIPRAIIRLARERKQAGHDSWGMRAAFEALRDRPDLVSGQETVPGGKRVMLNNDYVALMTPLVVRLAPDLAGYFRTRSHAAGNPGAQ